MLDSTIHYVDVEPIAQRYLEPHCRCIVVLLESEYDLVMGELFAKLTTYNIFNYLLPGAVFVFLVRAADVVTWPEQNIVVDLFVFYFAGMTISRIGSIMIEPLCKWLGIVRYAPYRDYLEAAQQDDKISELLEMNNVYRTMVSLLLCFGLIVAGSAVAVQWGLDAEAVLIGLGVALFLLYVLAYRKQTGYIRQRIENRIKR